MIALKYYLCPPKSLITMEASVDISMSPLKKGYEKHIIEFIKSVEKNKDIELKVNGLSTQIFGDYHQIMKCLTEEVYEAFLKSGDTVFVLKILNSKATEARLN